MRCGACSCSLARALLAGPALSSADRAAEASTTITCRRVQRPGRAVSSRHSHRNRAGCRATQDCPLCATPQQVPLPLLPLPTWRRELRAVPNARRRHPGRSSSKAFSCRNMLAKNLQSAKGTNPLQAEPERLSRGERIDARHPLGHLWLGSRLRSVAPAGLLPPSAAPSHQALEQPPHVEATWPPIRPMPSWPP